MNKYHELMEQIQVTEEAKSRIEKALRREALTVHSAAWGRRKVFHSRTWLAAAACIALLLAGSAALSTHRLPGLLPAESSSESSMLGSFAPTETASAKELSKILGFEITDIPSLAEKASEAVYTAFGDTADITYTLADRTISLRKSPGTEDNSGVYYDYGQAEEVDVNGVSVTLKGDNDTWSLALWNNGEFAFSVYAEPGLRMEEMIGVIGEVVRE